MLCTALALSIGLGSGCASQDDGAVNAASTTPTPMMATTPTRDWRIRPDATHDELDRAFLASEGQPIVEFAVATRAMRDGSFFDRDRCIELAQRTLPEVAPSVDELFALASQLRNDTFRDTVTMNLKVKNAALIICMSGREVGAPGREVMNVTTESIDEHVARLSQPSA